MLIKTDISLEIEHANVVVKNFTLKHWQNVFGHKNVKSFRKYLKVKTHIFL